MSATATYAQDSGKYDKSRIFSVWTYEFAPVLHLLLKRFFGSDMATLLEEYVYKRIRMKENKRILICKIIVGGDRLNGEYIWGEEELVITITEITLRKE